MCATIGTVHEISFEVSKVLRLGAKLKTPQGRILMGHINREQVTDRPKVRGKRFALRVGWLLPES